MSCGCTTTCGCILVEGPGIDIMQMGDTFVISVPDPVASNVADTDTVDLDVTLDTLTANVRIDPASTAPVTVGVDGIRIDCCGDASPKNLFIQETDPGPLTFNYQWWEIDNVGNLITMWVETGFVA